MKKSPIGSERPVARPTAETVRPRTTQIARPSQTPVPAPGGDAMVAPANSASTPMVLSPTPPSIEQARFDQVFPLLFQTYAGKPEQLIEILTAVKEARALGLDVTAPMRQLEGMTFEGGLQEIWGDFLTEQNTGAPPPRLEVSKVLKGQVQQELKQLANEGKTAPADLEALAERLSQAHDGAESLRAMMESFSRLPRSARSKFPPESLQWLAKHSSDMYGRWEQYSVVLRHLRPGKVLVDANQNKKLDAEDLLVSAGARGKTEKVGKALANEVAVRSAVVSAAQQLNDKRPQFAHNQWAQHFNQNKFERVADNGVFKAREGVSESAALLSVFAGEGSTAVDCATGSKTLVQYRAALAVLGPEDFDRVFDGLVVGSHMTSLAHGLEFRPSGGTDVSRVAPKRFLDELMPGDVVYFGKEHVTERDLATGWSGEWATYLGDGKFYGHPVGIRDYEGMKVFGELRHKKWTLSASVAEYDGGGVSSRYREFQKSLPERFAQLKRALSDSGLEGITQGVESTKGLLESTAPAEDPELTQLVQNRFLQSIQQVLGQVRAQSLSPSEGATLLGVQQSVLEGWMTGGVPRLEDITPANLSSWGASR